MFANVLLCLGVESSLSTQWVYFVTGAHFDVLSSRWPQQNNESLLHSRPVSPSSPSTPGKDVSLNMQPYVEPTGVKVSSITKASGASKPAVILTACPPTKKRKRAGKQTACASTQTDPCDLAARNRVLLQSLTKLKEKVNRRMRRMIALIESSTQPE